MKEEWLMAGHWGAHHAQIMLESGLPLTLCIIEPLYIFLLPVQCL